MVMQNILNNCRNTPIKSLVFLGEVSKCYNGRHVAFIPAFTCKARLHSQNVARRIQLVSCNKSQDKVTRPLMLLYSWTLAQDKHVDKYTKLYTNYGFDVLKIDTRPTAMLRPTKGSQILAAEVLKFLHENPLYSPLVVHGFSVGAYAFGEVALKIENEKRKHEVVKNKFIGQIWDSPVDVYGIPTAMSRALTDKKGLQFIFKNFFRLHLMLNYKIATIHYNKSSDMIHQNSIGVPALFLYSKADVFSPPDMNENVYKKWEYSDRPMPCYSRCFEESGHVAHFAKYPEEYVKEISTFLQRIGLSGALIDVAKTGQ